MRSLVLWCAAVLLVSALGGALAGGAALEGGYAQNNRTFPNVTTPLLVPTLPLYTKPAERMKRVVRCLAAGEVSQDLSHLFTVSQIETTPPPPPTNTPPVEKSPPAGATPSSPPPSEPPSGGGGLMSPPPPPRPPRPPRGPPRPPRGPPRSPPPPRSPRPPRAPRREEPPPQVVTASPPPTVVATPSPPPTFDQKFLAHLPPGLAEKKLATRRAEQDVLQAKVALHKAIYDETVEGVKDSQDMGNKGFGNTTGFLTKP